MRGALVAAITLIALQVVVSTPLANVIGAAALPARWAAEWMSPYVPLIPARAATPAQASPPPGHRAAQPAQLPPAAPNPLRFTA